MGSGSSGSRLDSGNVNLKVNVNHTAFLAYPVSCTRRLFACEVKLMKSGEEVHTM